MTLPKDQRKYPQFHPKTAGIGSAFELAIRFVDWADQFKGGPSSQQIRAHWQVSKATAYRWLAAWKAARGASA